MKKTAFIGYVGERDFHDGFIVAVTRKADVVHVRIRGAGGQDYDVAFGGVHAVRANRPAGMELYSLSEMRSHPPQRRFVFDGWDEDSPASLEIDAERFEISKMASRARKPACVKPFESQDFNSISG